MGFASFTHPTRYKNSFYRCKVNGKIPEKIGLSSQKDQHHKLVESYSYYGTTGYIVNVGFLQQNTKIAGEGVGCAFAGGDLSYEWRQ